LIEGHETFELLGETDVYDIADVILDVIGEYIEMQNEEKKLIEGVGKIDLTRIPYEDKINDIEKSQTSSQKVVRK